MKEDSGNLYLSHDEPQRSTLLALRSIVLAYDGHITETVKYGMACFMYGKNNLCYLWTDRKTQEPYLLLVEGKYLDHPRLEQGSRSRMKILRIDPHADIPLAFVHAVLKDAIRLYKEGIVKLR